MMRTYRVELRPVILVGVIEMTLNSLSRGPNKDMGCCTCYGDIALDDSLCHTDETTIIPFGRFTGHDTPARPLGGLLSNEVI